MVKKCICEICVCGRHRCPHRPWCTPTDKPCMLTEYTKTYHPHPLSMRENFKPTQTALDSDAPLEDKTTHRVDYIKHPLEKPFLHNPDPYKKPCGEQDLLTSYTKDYPEKWVPPAKPIKQDQLRQVPSKFDGETNYVAEYRKWDSERPKRYVPDAAYKPPTDPFECLSTFQRDYRRYNEKPVRSLKPTDAAMSSGPFDGLTGYRQEYVKHPLEGRKKKDKEVYQPPGCPLDCLTTNRRDYRGKPGEKLASCKPDTTFMASDAPFDDDTTFKSDYRKWPTERPYQYNPDPYKKPEGDMDMNTMHRIAYKQHPLARSGPFKPAPARVMDPGCFDGITNYHAEYKPWEVERVHPTMKPEYKPNCAPFEGCSTKQSHYVRHPMQPLHSFKPGLTTIDSGPFDDGTMYRMEYTPKESEPCPAAILDTSRAAYTYVEQAPTGHKFYRPIYTSVTPLTKSSAPQQQQPVLQPLVVS